MSFLGWMGLVGGLLLMMALASEYIRRLPVTSSAIYLLLGVVLGPIGLHLVAVDFAGGREWLEHLTEVALIISLFIGGLKLRLPLRDKAWRAAFWLAGPVMLASILCVAIFAHFVFGLGWGASLLLGAVLAPTDPVLAGTVTVEDAQDNDRMRYGLSGEAGFNDGMAFPFVVMALLWEAHGAAGTWMAGWFFRYVLYAVPAGLLLGFALGKGLGHAAIRIRHTHQETTAPNDFLALALIAISYTLAELIGAWGFLAAFAAGLGLRNAEIGTIQRHPLGDVGSSHPPAEMLVGPTSEHAEQIKNPGAAAGMVVGEILSFGGHLERLLEVLLVVLVGVCLALAWDARAVGLAFALFFLIRPLAVWLLLSKSAVTPVQRVLMGWFGLRGIGSLYYLAYALNHDPTGQAEQIVGLTLTVVALSVVFHGTTAQPVLHLYERLVELRNAPTGRRSGLALSTSG